jgi:hypothetical protein
MSEPPREFCDAIASPAARLAGEPLTRELGPHLEAVAPADSELFTRIEALCVQGVTAGCLGAREQGGIKFSRAIKRSDAMRSFSVCRGDGRCDRATSRSSEQGDQYDHADDR